MSDVKFCPDCGARLVSGDRFCGECGFDTASVATPEPDEPVLERQPAAEAMPPPVEPGPPPRPAKPTTPFPAGGAAGAAALGRTHPGGGVQSSGNKNALLIVVSLLAVVFLAGGGIFWWLSKDKPPGSNTSLPAAAQKQPAEATAQPPQEQMPSGALAEEDLSRASTYLSKPGLKLTFFVNYPDGTAGIVNRISGLAVPNEAVRVSEVEVGIDRGEEYGFGFHYVERPDGTYYILDDTPFEIFPVLKNNLTIGQTWNYQDESGAITWTVVDMGVDLDLGFAKFNDCLLVRENNPIVGWQAITYYAPGKGSVLVIDPGGSIEYYKITAQQTIDPAQAAATVIKWCPNYMDIKDDRTQKY